MRPKRKLIYLASPHKHFDESVMEARYIGVVEAQAKLEQQGHMIFCPIAHSHPAWKMAQSHGGHSPSWDYYEEFDTKLLSVCSELWVLKLEGWSESIGVKAEIKIAKGLGMPVRYIDSEDLEWPMIPTMPN